MAAVKGRPAETRLLAEPVLEDVNTLECPRWDVLEAQRALGIAALCADRPDEAVLHLQAVWDYTTKEHVDDPGAFPVAADLIEALAQTGAQAAAAAVLERLEVLARAQSHPWGLVTVLRGAATLQLADGYDEESVQALSDAASRYGALGLEFDEGRCLLCLGGYLRRYGKRAEARRRLEQTIELFERLGCEGWADEGRRELSRVSGRKSGPDELTASEQQVVDLAVSGLSNKEIASALFVSVYTVEAHLTHAYAKLGVRSRSQLARRLEELAEP